MNKIISRTLLLLLIAVAIHSCCAKKAPPEPDYAALGYKKATVINYALDGCMWMLEMEDKTKKEPQNLPEDFRVENKAVWVKFKPAKKGSMSICMAGEMVEIEDIKSRN
ncbi:MAG: hypothetical protein IT233_09280 [Bacteroidia bacterium]|nr:hypothetical protein [Bacteroidia bacterium]